MSENENFLSSNETDVTLWLLPYDKVSYQASKRDVAKLSATELARYQSCRLSRQKEFLLGRMLLRHALAEQLACPINKLDVDERQRMPPYVPLAEENGIRFSICHSHSLIAVAIARCGIAQNTVLGADVEYINPARGLSAAAVFCNAMQKQLIENSVSSSEKKRLYYLFWTQKEAYFKACFYSEASSALSTIDFDEVGRRQGHDLSAASLEFMVSGQAERYQCAVYSSWTAVPIVKQLMLEENHFSPNYQELCPQWSHYKLVID